MSVITKDLGVATAYGYAKSKGYTGTEEEFAELMASYADVAQQAEAAAQDAEDAKDEAVTAKTDAQTAKTAAQAAQSAAETASGTASAKASEAAQSAQSAAGSASAAQISATAASGSAQTAQTAAQTATNKASEASSSASAASTAKTGAETARTGAQTAQTAAETAQANAEAAASSVSASAAQIEQNTEEIGAIKNDLSEKADKSEALSAYIVETETGAIASFTDGADDVPVKDLTVAIEPVQSGSGDPSPENVRPISGWTGANVVRTGKNLLPKLSATTTTVNGITFTVFDDGTINVNGTSTGVASIEILANTKNDLSGLLLSGTPEGYNQGNCAIAVQYWNDGAFSSSAFQINGADLTIEEADNIYIMVRVASGVTINNVVFRPMARLATETDASYEPYQGETYEVDWTTEAGTVYGGTLDVTNGVLTVDRAYLTNAWLVSNNKWTIAGNGVWVISDLELPTIDSQTYINPKLIATAMRTSYQNDLYINKTLGIAQWWTKRIGISTGDETLNLVTFKAFLGENGSDIVYPVLNPQTYQLTPQEVSTILGKNNIFADTGNVTVQYRADTKLYIDKVVNA